MKRLWIGIAFLAMLLAGGILLSFGMIRVHNRISDQLAAASHAALSQDWDEAIRLSDFASSIWEKYRHVTAAFTDHEPIEKMDCLFQRLDIYRDPTRFVEYAIVCRHLSQISGAIAEGHSLTWWNLL